MPPGVVNLAYLVAAVCFILAFKGLAHPRTAVRGNLIGAFGMLLAIVVTLLDKHILSYTAIFAGMLLGVLPVGTVLHIVGKRLDARRAKKVSEARQALIALGRVQQGLFSNATG